MAPPPPRFRSRPCPSRSERSSLRRSPCRTDVFRTCLAASERPAQSTAATTHCSPCRRRQECPAIPPSFPSAWRDCWRAVTSSDEATAGPTKGPTYSRRWSPAPHPGGRIYRDRARWIRRRRSRHAAGGERRAQVPLPPPTGATPGRTSARPPARGRDDALGGEPGEASPACLRSASQPRHRASGKRRRRGHSPEPSFPTAEGPGGYSPRVQPAGISPGPAPHAEPKNSALRSPVTSSATDDERGPPARVFEAATRGGRRRSPTPDTPSPELGHLLSPEEAEKLLVPLEQLCAELGRAVQPGASARPDFPLGQAARLRCAKGASSDGPDGMSWGAEPVNAGSRTLLGIFGDLRPDQSGPTSP